MLVQAGTAVNLSETRKQGAIRIKSGTILEIGEKKPKQYPHQKPAPTKCNSGQHWNREDPGHHGLLQEEPNDSSQLPSSVEPGSPSQPQPKLPHGHISQACSHRQLYRKTLRSHDSRRTEKLNNMRWKPTLDDIHEVAFPGSPPSQLVFRGRFTHFTFGLWRLSDDASGTLLDNQQALQRNHTLKNNNLMMPLSGYSAHG